MPKPLVSGDLIEDFPTVVFTRRPDQTVPLPPPPRRWTVERTLLYVNLALAAAVLVEWFVI